MKHDQSLALAVRGLVIAAERYRAHAARYQLGVSPTEIVALGHLYTEGPLTATELATRLQITSASATELVDRLEKTTYARRHPHPTDRRKRLITLTDHGRQALHATYNNLGDELAEIYTAFTPDQQRTIDHFLSATTVRLTAPTGAGRTVGDRKRVQTGL
ncbi:MAG: MarR family transcriptional regulator [Streptosporangiaceae bacterium]|nr:MarR family transcriptional regulator [Streptosporangiaceae bacterium]